MVACGRQRLLRIATVGRIWLTSPGALLPTGRFFLATPLAYNHFVGRRLTTLTRRRKFRSRGVFGPDSVVWLERTGSRWTPRPSSRRLPSPSRDGGSSGGAHRRIFYPWADHRTDPPALLRVRVLLERAAPATRPEASGPGVKKGVAHAALTAARILHHYHRHRLSPWAMTAMALFAPSRECYPDSGGSN